MKKEERRTKNEVGHGVPPWRTSAFIALRSSFFVFHVGVVLFLAAQDLAAQDPPRVTGVVKNVDLEVGTITVRRKSAADDARFNLLKKDIEVTEPSGRKVPLDAIR